MKNTILMLASFCLIGILHAQEAQKISTLDSVVIDTKVKKPRKNSGKLIATITQEMIAANPGLDVATLINQVSGIEINGNSSNAGQNLSYFVRGGNSRQVAILVDGVPLTDPSSIANEFDLRLQSPSSIESIEIMKGASSVLYGSGAATAVISIKTKKASKEPIAANFRSSVGSNSASETDSKKYQLAEFANAATIGGTLNRFNYNLNFSHRYVDGISAIAAPEDETAFESDIFDSFNSRLNIGVDLSDKISLSRFVGIDKFKADFDDFSYVDANNVSTSQQLRTGGQFKWKYNKGSFIVNDSYSWLQRDIASSFPTRYDAQNYTVDGFASYQFSDAFSAVIGLQYVDAKFSSEAIPFGGTDFEQQIDDATATYQSVDPYVNINFVSEFGFAMSAGARMNNHSEYGSQLVYNANPSYSFDLSNSALKLLGSYSTAYITPSLFQLFDVAYGNIDLAPEENTTIEGGLEFTTSDGFRASAVYFQRTENNYVDFVTVDPDLFIFQYQNVAPEFTASGVEVELAKKFNSKLHLMANYTNTTPDSNFGLRIPTHKANLSAFYKITSATNLSLQYQYVGTRDDAFFNSETFESEEITLDAYNLLGLSASKQVSNNVQVFASVSNLLNVEYEELYRYQTTGRNFRLGIELNF